MTPRTRRIVIIGTAALIAVLVGSQLLKWAIDTYGPVYTAEEYNAVAPIDNLVESFIEVVHTSDFDPPGEYDVINKWSGPVRYAFLREFPGWHRDVALGHIGLLSRLTGLAFERLENRRENIDLYLYYKTDARAMSEIGVKHGFRKQEMKDLAKDHNCFGLLRVGGQDKSRIGVVVFGYEKSQPAAGRCIIRS